ncbi:hypothetical protein [Geminicoccus harenae]|nr:hypothetical protein [Geminicoccus harenae]
MSSTTIMPARSPDDIAAAARLFQAYAASLSVDLAYQVTLPPDCPRS